MPHCEQEFNTLVRIEEHLLNAMSEVQAAARRLTPETQLHGDVQAVEEALGEAIALSSRAKRLALHAWRISLRQQAA